MYEQDYILRLIQRVGNMMRAMFSALKEHRADDALHVARQAIGELFETDVEMIDALSGEGLVTFLGAGGVFDTLKALALAEILKARADAFEQTGDSRMAARERTRAHVLLSHARPLAMGDEIEQIEQLIGTLEDA